MKHWLSRKTVVNNMTMKITYILFLLTFLFGCSKPMEGYKVSGIVKETKNGPYQDYIYLGYGNLKDSALVDKNGRFEFNGNLKYPARAFLHLKPPSATVAFYLENSEIFISGQFYKSFQNETNYNLFYIDSLSGSESNSLVEEYSNFKKEIKSNDNYNELIVNKLINMTLENPKNSIVGTMLADEAVKSNKIFSLEELKKAYNNLDKSYQIKSEMELIEKGIIQLENSSLGDTFMDFTITGHKRDSIEFRQLKGKIILIDFWASWCQPCIKKHPKMVELYRKMNKNKFEILGISIDKNKKSWLKSLEANTLPWINGLDEMGFVQNNYGINAIPFNYLLNENGEIISVNKSLEEIENIIIQLK